MQFVCEVVLVFGSNQMSLETLDSQIAKALVKSMSLRAQEYMQVPRHARKEECPDVDRKTDRFHDVGLGSRSTTFRGEQMA